LPCWSLIGRVGTNTAVFAVGAQASYSVKTTGRLYFGVNDNSLYDNSGSWTAVVTVQRATMQKAPP
jgi:hypothetical protein